jgi:hypothetical protein
MAINEILMHELERATAGFGEYHQEQEFSSRAAVTETLTGPRYSASAAQDLILSVQSFVFDDNTLSDDPTRLR